MRNLLRSFIFAASLVLLSVAAPAANLITENFDDVTTLAGNGWATVNNSSPIGASGWFQGIGGLFPANSGGPDSYVAANYLNAEDPDLGNGGNISNWLITPQLTLVDQVQLVFFTRTIDSSAFPDLLELRLSLNGSSTNVGVTDTSVGDFTTLLLTVNPTLSSGGYPETWTQYVATAFFPSAVSGRFAFRYAVPDNTVNGNYIGIDNVRVDAQVPEPSTVSLLVLGGLIVAARRRRQPARA